TWKSSGRSTRSRKTGTGRCSVYNLGRQVTASSREVFMTRARFVFAATLVGATLVAGTALAQATEPPAQTAAPPLTPILAGKQLTPPLRGQGEVEFTQPTTKRMG